MNNRLDYNDIMPFGKHKGQQVKDVLLSQPDYILWAERRTQHKFDAHIVKLAERMLSDRDSKDYNDWSDPWDTDIMDRD